MVKSKGQDTGGKGQKQGKREGFDKARKIKGST